MEQRLVSPLAEQIAKLDGGPWYQRRDVADLLGVTPGAVIALADRARHPELVPKMAVRWRGQVIRLWSKTQLEAMREHFARPGAGAGRPRMWSAAETQARRRVRDQIRHHTARAERIAKADPAGAHEAASRARELQNQLDAQTDRRKAVRVGV